VRLEKERGDPGAGLAISQPERFDVKGDVSTMRILLTTLLLFINPS
jgi:hypothetical protein